MLRFIAHRLWQSAVTLLAIVAATFFIIRNAPGNPFMSEKAALPHVRAELSRIYGLDRPQVEQLVIYLKKAILHADLGPSMKHQDWTVSEIIGGAFPISLQLGLSAIVVALIVGIPIGVVAAVRRNTRTDWSLMSLAMIGICLPTFVIGPMLALTLGMKLHIFNVGGWFDWRDGILPSLALGLYQAAYVARMTRAGMLEVLTSDFIRTARAKGVAGPAVVYRHGLRVGLTPVVAYLGPALAGLVTGGFVTENVFQVPGLGQHFVAAARNSDYWLLLGATTFFAALLIAANIVVDIVQAWLNPRIRLGS